MTRSIAVALGTGAGAAAAHTQTLTADLTTTRLHVARQAMTFDAADSGVGVASHLGRPSLYVGHGVAYLPDVHFTNGTIELDMSVKGAFLGVAFRVHDQDDYELIYFRPGGSGTDEAVQYTPTLLGAIAWQIYAGPGASGTAVIPPTHWFHVRLEVVGRTAKVFVENQREPALVVPHLRQEYGAGSIGVWGAMGGGYFSNLQYTPAAETPSVAPGPTFGAGMLTNWEISDAFETAVVNPEIYPVQTLTWERVAAEEPGMVVLNRYRRSPEAITGFGRFPIRSPDQLVTPVSTAKARVVFARTTLYSDRDQTKKMNIGYSDEVVVYVNAQPMFEGKAEFAFREPGAQGYMNVNNDAVFLPLRKGRNELLLAVSEYWAGWGFICKLTDWSGLRDGVPAPRPSGSAQ